MNVKKRILIVDDDELILNSLEALVKMAGFDVITAATGATAIAKIDQGHPDLVILDLILPGPSGVEVLNHMKQGPAMGVPVVIITANGPDNAIVVQAREAPNVHDFIQKPIRKDVLIGALKRILKVQ